MVDIQIQSFVSLFQLLNQQQKNELMHLLMKEMKIIHYKKEHFHEIKEKTLNKKVGISCPHCNSTDIIGFGFYRKRKRYKCKNCLRNFNELTATPMAGTHYPERWEHYIQCMFQGMSLRATAAELDISLPTAFYWRHKILNALDRIKLPQFAQVVETDKTHFSYSEKGAKTFSFKNCAVKNEVKRKKLARFLKRTKVEVVTSADHDGNLKFEVASPGRINTKDLEAALRAHIDEDTILCTEDTCLYEQFSSEQGIRHVKLRGRKKTRLRNNYFHIDTVTNYNRGLHQWMSIFHGVATKYLSNYLAWYRTLELLSLNEEKVHEFAKYMLQRPKKLTIEGMLSHYNAKYLSTLHQYERLCGICK